MPNRLGASFRIWVPGKNSVAPKIGRVRSLQRGDFQNVRFCFHDGHAAWAAPKCQVRAAAMVRLGKPHTTAAVRASLRFWFGIEHVHGTAT